MASLFAAAGDFRECHALILDPFLSNRRLLRDTLKALGCGDVRDTGRAEEARAILNDGGANALFLDWSDGTDALAFLRALRAPDNPHRCTPVVVMTTFADPGHVVAARDAGANEFMLRPWSAEIVASRLRALVHHPRRFIQANEFFGPDRRRRRGEWRGPDRRAHQEWRGPAERRKEAESDPVFQPLERRNAPRV